MSSLGSPSLVRAASSRQSSILPSFHPSFLPLDFSRGFSPTPASCRDTLGKPFPATRIIIWGLGRGILLPCGFAAGRASWEGNSLEHGRGDRSRVTSCGSLGGGWWLRVTCHPHPWVGGKPARVAVTCRKDIQGFNPCVLGTCSPESSRVFEAVVIRAGRPGWDQPCPRPH